MTTLTDLARVRALFQQRAVVALLTEQPKGQTMDIETCPDCNGSGSSAHPDSGYECYKCEGTGGISVCTYTAADLEAVARAVLEAAANLAGNFTQAQHAAHDISTGVFPGQSPNREAMAGCIRALDLTTIIARATGGKSDD